MCHSVSGGEHLAQSLDMWMVWLGGFWRLLEPHLGLTAHPQKPSLIPHGAQTARWKPVRTPWNQL